MRRVDYSAAAGVFAFRHNGPRRHMTHRRFPTTAEALQFAVEGLPPSAQAVLETDEERFEGLTVRQMYEAETYPLERAQRPLS